MLKVAADDNGANDGCGATGRTVSFQVDGVTLLIQEMWDNTKVWNLPALPQGNIRFS